MGSLEPDMEGYAGRGWWSRRFTLAIGSACFPFPERSNEADPLLQFSMMIYKTDKNGYTVTD